MVGFGGAGKAIWGSSCLAAIPALRICKGRRSGIIGWAFTLYLSGHVASCALELFWRAYPSRPFTVGARFCTVLAGQAYILLGTAMLFYPACHPRAAKAALTVVLAVVLGAGSLGVICIAGDEVTPMDNFSLYSYSVGVIWGVLGLALAIHRHRQEASRKCCIMAGAAFFGVVNALGEIGLFAAVGVPEHLCSFLARTLDSILWLPGAVTFFRWLDEQDPYHHHK